MEDSIQANYMRDVRFSGRWRFKLWSSGLWELV